MKKKITRLDGTTEEYEGTPEELAQLEKSLKEEGSADKTPKGKKRLLTEEEKAEVRDIVKDEIAKPVSIGRALEELLKPRPEMEPKEDLPSIKPWVHPYPTLPRFRRETRRCMFDGLPPGVYGIACPCPKCSVWCGVSVTSKVMLGTQTSPIQTGAVIGPTWSTIVTNEMRPEYSVRN